MQYAYGWNASGEEGWFPEPLDAQSVSPVFRFVMREASLGAHFHSLLHRCKKINRSPHFRSQRRLLRSLAHHLQRNHRTKTYKSPPRCLSGTHYSLRSLLPKKANQQSFWSILPSKLDLRGTKEDQDQSGHVSTFEDVKNSKMESLTNKPYDKPYEVALQCGLQEINSKKIKVVSY